jgi:hypothetical protein
VAVSDSYNDSSDNSTNSSVTYASLSNQDLEASVTGASVNFNGDSDDRAGVVTTGDISASGGSYANFAGIQTASSNTGVGSINQAATAVSANANISFGQ